MSNMNNLQEIVGIEITKSVKKRYSQIMASYDFNELMKNNLGHPHPLKGDLQGYYAIGLTGNYRLLIENNNNKIKVRGVIDYHGDKYNWIIP